MPNLFALLVLYSWPVLAFLLYRYLPVQRAFIWSIMLGYLFMPPASAAFNLPALPEFSKIEIAAVSSFVMAIAFHGVKILKFPRHPLMIAVVLIYLSAPIFTTLTNADPVVFGEFVASGFAVTEIPALVFERLFYMFPFLLAYSLLSTPKYLQDMLIALVIGAVIYSAPIMFEARISPQLNQWVYGFFQHAWDQMIRGGGFRSIVFLYHPLWVGMFTLMGTVAATALYLHGTRPERSFAMEPSFVLRRFASQNPNYVYGYITVFMFVVLVISKSLGPILLSVTVVATLLMLSRIAQLWVAFLAAVVVLVYPVLQGFEVFPNNALVGAAQLASGDRAISLAFRFTNEDLLLGRAMERAFFGWGENARHLFLDPFDGRILTIPDGQWVITLGAYGIFGFIGEIGVLLLPIFFAFQYRRISDPTVLSPFVPAYVLILAANSVDLLPNATLTPLSMMLAGAVWRHLETVPERQRNARVQSIQEEQPAPLFGGTVLPYAAAKQKQRTIL